MALIQPYQFESLELGLARGIDLDVGRGRVGLRHVQACLPVSGRRPLHLVGNLKVLVATLRPQAQRRIWQPGGVDCQSIDLGIVVIGGLIIFDQ